MNSGSPVSDPSERVGLVVNCYERTYRDVLAPGFFASICGSVLRPLEERVALINNVRDIEDARDRAERLLAKGEITSFAFVADYRSHALNRAGLLERALGDHPYFLDYGLVMPHVTQCEWLLGWDAEVRLERPVNWIDPAIALMRAELTVFSASVNWPRRGTQEGSLPTETVERSGDFCLNWNFSDQIFLLPRARLLAPIFRDFAPYAWIRNADHPWSFESRIEAHQRARRMFRATYEPVRYEHNDNAGHVLERVGWTRRDRFQSRLLKAVGKLIRHLPSGAGPRWKEL